MHAAALDTFHDTLEFQQSNEKTKTKNSLQGAIDDFIESKKSNFQEFLRSEGFLIDSMFCEGTDTKKQELIFEEALQSAEKTTATCTVKGKQIYIIARVINRVEKILDLDNLKHEFLLEESKNHQ